MARTGTRGSTSAQFDRQVEAMFSEGWGGVENRMETKLERERETERRELGHEGCARRDWIYAFG